MRLPPRESEFLRVRAGENGAAVQAALAPQGAETTHGVAAGADASVDTHEAEGQGRAGTGPGPAREV